MNSSLLIQQSEKIANAIEEFMRPWEPGINIGIMTTNYLELDDQTLWGDHLQEIGEPNTSVDAESIMDYWLRNRDKMGVKDIFMSYYESAMNQYIKDHALDTDAWDRNLEQEFVRTAHLSAEKACIQPSLARLTQLSEAEREQAENLSINYLTFARRERMKRYPIEHPTDRILEETFLDPYREGGAATLCMEWLRVKHDICWDSLKSDAPLRILLGNVAKGTYTYNVFIPEYVKEEIEDFKSPERFPDFKALEKEIQNNLDQCQDRQQRMNYLRSLLDPFADYAHAFNPKAEIERWEAPKNTAQQLMKQWGNMGPGAMNENTGEPLNPQHYIDRLRKAIESMEKEIAFQKQFQNYFLNFSNQGCTRNPSNEEQTMCVYLNFWRRQMYDFVQMLLPIASRYGIHFSEIQKQSGIYVLDADDLNDTADASLDPHTDESSRTIAAQTENAQQETPSQSTDNKEKQQKEQSIIKGNKPYRTDCCFFYDNQEYFNVAIQECTNLLHKYKRIPDNIDFIMMLALFSGKPCTYTYQWFGSKADLAVIIKTLLPDRAKNPTITTWPPKTSKWYVVSQRFVDEKGKPLTKIEHLKKGGKNKAMIAEVTDAFIKNLPRKQRSITK